MLARQILSSVLTIAAVVSLASESRAVTPDNPEVQKLIKKGLAYLEKAPADGRLGARCLAGLAFLKNGYPASHPKVEDGIKACQAATRAEPDQMQDDIYSLGIAVIFLCALDTSKYHEEIEKLLKALEHRQKEHGGWGYPERETGDTSMTQYGVLSAWEAKQAGFLVSLDSIERVSNWLIRTQDPSGGWAYQGEDPGDFTLRPQAVTLSMSTAASGSSIICAHMLGMLELKEEKKIEGLPSALVEVKPEDQKAGGKGGPITNRVEKARLLRAADRGSAWMRGNYKIESENFTYYYLYALERFMSFRELADGNRPEEPRWYNDGYRFLAKEQKDDGSWVSQSGAVPDTAFAILFLSRSTKKSIEKSEGLGDGTLVGGRGLPRNLVDAKLKRGRVVAAGLGSTTEEMLRILNDPNHPDYDYLAENPDELSIVVDDEKRRGEQVESLKRLVRSGPPEARLVAAGALARLDDLDVVPTLIFALSDPDPRVVRQARDGLRFVSRKFEGFGLADAPALDAKLTAIAKWKAWYKTIRPDAQFEN